MKYFCFFGLFLITHCIFEEAPEIQFSYFKKTYNKSYANKTEEIKRFDIFKKNIAKYGEINQYSDIPDREEALIILSQKRGLPIEFNYIYDLGPAKHQKDCGFCSVFSFITQVEAQFSIKYGKNYRFSEQELLDCSGSTLTCNKNNFVAIESFMNNRNYLTLESKYETYTGVKTPRSCESIAPLDKKYSSTIKLSVGRLTKKTLIGSRYTINCLKALLIKNGPIGTMIHSSLIKNYKGDIIVSDKECDKNAEANHAVTIIGYGYQPNLGDYWIIRNSYGSDWGESGNFRVLAGHDICGIESYAYYFDIKWDSWCGEGCDQCSYDSQNKKLNCQSCIYGYTYDSKYKRCIKCIEGCKSCSSSTICDECNEGYFKYNPFKCEKCIKGCKVCSGYNDYNCKEWYIGDSLNTNDNLDDEIEDYCFCNSKYLVLAISLIILNLLY